MPLESDVANADTALHVQFYEFQGEGPFKGVVHVRITTPGDKTSTPDRPASEADKRRFQREWLHYQMQHDNADVIGTPLLVWQKERPDELPDGQLQELYILKFQTAEQVARMTDHQVLRIGLGGEGLRRKAQLYLASKNAQLRSAELENAKDEIEMLKANMARMQEQFAAQMAQVSQMAQQPAPKPRGRPRKYTPHKAKVADVPNIATTDASDSQ